MVNYGYSPKDLQLCIGLTVKLSVYKSHCGKPLVKAERINKCTRAARDQNVDLRLHPVILSCEKIAIWDAPSTFFGPHCLRF